MPLTNMQERNPLPMRAMAFRSMKIVALLSAFAFAGSAFAQAPPRPLQPRLVSPEVSSDGKITFRIRAPKAEEVRLGGSDLPGLGQSVAMTKGTNDVWEITTGPVRPGAYRYNFNVDGVSVIDPRN